MKLLVISAKKIILFILLILFVTFLCIISSHNSVIETTSDDLEDISDTFFVNVQNIMKSQEKIAYLTFDDGPTSSVTPKILDILKQYNIQATFFVIGKRVEEHPEIVKRAYEEGHFIANHGYSHDNTILYKNEESFISEIKKTDIAIGKAINIENYCSHLFRFPNGYMSPLYKKQKEKAVQLLQQMGYSYIDWNCLTKDAEKKCSNATLLQNLKQTSQKKNTLVVLMHDTKDVNDSSLVLKDAILYLMQKGYTFQNFYSLID